MDAARSRREEAARKAAEVHLEHKEAKAELRSAQVDHVKHSAKQAGKVALVATAVVVAAPVVLAAALTASAIEGVVDGGRKLGAATARGYHAGRALDLVINETVSGKAQQAVHAVQAADHRFNKGFSEGFKETSPVEALLGPKDKVAQFFSGNHVAVHPSLKSVGNIFKGLKQNLGYVFDDIKQKRELKAENKADAVADIKHVKETYAANKAQVSQLVAEGADKEIHLAGSLGAGQRAVREALVLSQVRKAEKILKTQYRQEYKNDLNEVRPNRSEVNQTANRSLLVDAKAIALTSVEGVSALKTAVVGSAKNSFNSDMRKIEWAAGGALELASTGVAFTQNLWSGVKNAVQAVKGPEKAPVSVVPRGPTGAMA